MVDITGTWVGSTSSTPSFEPFDKTELTCRVTFEDDQPKVSLTFGYHDGSKSQVQESIVLNSIPQDYIFNEFAYSDAVVRIVGSHMAGKKATYTISYEDEKFVVTCILYGGQNEYGGKYTYTTIYVLTDECQ